MFNFLKKPEKRLMVEFSLDYNDNIEVKYNYDHNDTINSTKLATMLYCINNGLFMNHCIEFLQKQKNYVHSSIVFDKWNEYEQKQTKHNNEPIVKPLDAFLKNVK